jgi:hypothetical protein
VKSTGRSVRWSARRIGDFNRRFHHGFLGLLQQVANMVTTSGKEGPQQKKLESDVRSENSLPTDNDESIRGLT